ncbi:MAG: hypothetical protein HOY71_18075, partial [Nonomuraea sp.]|nr:hypothetical protein [Nonomuraea sp.]
MERPSTAELLATCVLRMLGQRGLDVSAEAYERITTCADDVQLACWYIQARWARIVDDLFDTGLRSGLQAGDR